MDCRTDRTQSSNSRIFCRSLSFFEYSLDGIPCSPSAIQRKASGAKAALARWETDDSATTSQLASLNVTSCDSLDTVSDGSLSSEAIWNRLCGAGSAQVYSEWQQATYIVSGRDNKDTFACASVFSASEGSVMIVLESKKREPNLGEATAPVRLAFSDIPMFDDHVNACAAVTPRAPTFYAASPVRPFASHQPAANPRRPTRGLS